VRKQAVSVFARLTLGIDDDATAFRSGAACCSAGIQVSLSCYFRTGDGGFMPVKTPGSVWAATALDICVFCKLAVLRNLFSLSYSCMASNNMDKRYENSIIIFPIIGRRLKNKFSILWGCRQVARRRAAQGQTSSLSGFP
jgi:hypothetical protein